MPSNKILYTGAADFKAQAAEELPGVARAQDGIARQDAVYESSKVLSEAEEHLERNVTGSLCEALNVCLSAKRKRIDQLVPRSFA